MEKPEAHAMAAMSMTNLEVIRITCMLDMFGDIDRLFEGFLNAVSMHAVTRPAM